MEPEDVFTYSKVKRMNYQRLTLQDVLSQIFWEKKDDSVWNIDLHQGWGVLEMGTT